MDHATTHAHGAHGHDDHHKGAVRTYTLVLAALLVLTVITVAASYVNFGSGFVNVLVAMGIATLKASLVALFFMHLLHDNRMNLVILLSSFLFLGIFLGSLLTDVGSRDVVRPANLKTPLAAPAVGTGPAGTPAPGAAAGGHGAASEAHTQPGAAPGATAPAAGQGGHGQAGQGQAGQGAAPNH